MANETSKRAAGAAAARLIAPNMVIGLGTGTTARFFIDAVGERIRREGLVIRGGVATSQGSEELARHAGIPLLPLTDATRPDLTVDGADEIDPGLHLIKGGGGALVREKLVAASSGRMLVIVDSGKVVPTLGAFPLPVAVFSFGIETTLARLAAAFPDAPATLRPDPATGTPFRTDDGLHIVDMAFGAIADPAALEDSLRGVVGVAEVGLFVGIAASALVGHEDGSVSELRL